MQCCDEQDMEQKENCNIWLHLILRFFSMRSAVSLEEQIDQEDKQKPVLLTSFQIQKSSVSRCFLYLHINATTCICMSNFFFFLKANIYTLCPNIYMLQQELNFSK